MAKSETESTQDLELSDERAALVATVKADVAAGRYETEEKVDAAIEKLLDAM